jgi:phage-related protein
MAIQTFTWSVENGATGDITHRVRSVQFGDGYSQKAADGLNSKSQSWPISHTGPQEQVRAIVDFLDLHRGAKAFLWTPPLGELGLFTCASYRTACRGGEVYTLTATFEQTFHP